MAEPRMSLTTLLVLRELLTAAQGERYGLEIAQATGIAGGSMYPILKRLTAVGWTSDRTEDTDPVTARRPARRYYRLTPEGRDRALAALSHHAKRLAVLDRLGLAEDGGLEPQAG